MTELQAAIIFSFLSSAAWAIVAPAPPSQQASLHPPGQLFGEFATNELQNGRREMAMYQSMTNELNGKLASTEGQLEKRQPEEENGEVTGSQPSQTLARQRNINGALAGSQPAAESHARDVAAQVKHRSQFQACQHRVWLERVLSTDELMACQTRLLGKSGRLKQALEPPRYSSLLDSKLSRRSFRRSVRA
ncbi:hypothetical protein H101_07100 [Trichophyton interdigitale H6]|nr:hypothetical protein H101_07100 [Trichophyton interdigitale H6]